MDEPSHVLLEQQTSEEKASPMDELIDKVGSHGRYQWLSFVVYGMHWLLLGWMLMGISFYYETKPFECPELAQHDCRNFVCSLSESEWPNYLKNPPRSITYQWEWLVCQNEFGVSVLQALIAIGACLGLVVCSHLADNLGRKLAITAAWASATLGLALFAFSNGLIMVGCGSFLVGFGLNSAIVLDFAFINQLSTGKARQYYSVGVQLFLATSESIVGYAMYWIDDWRVSIYFVLGLAVVVNVAHIFLIETPKFMITKDIDKTVAILNRIAKINGREIVTYDEVLEAYEKEQVTADQNTNIAVLFRYKSLRIKTVSCSVLFFGLQIVYTCAILSVGSIGFEARQNQLAMGVSEGVAYIIAQIVIPFVRRRAFSMATMAGSGLLCLSIAVLTMITDSLNTVELVLLFLMRLVVCMVYAILFVYVAELYPTRVRGLGLGLANITGTLGTMLSPFIILLSDTSGVNRWIIPGAVGLLATLGVLPLTETLGRPMQEEIYERKKSTILKNTLRSNLM